MEAAKRFAASEKALIQVYGREIKIQVELKDLSATGAYFEVLHGDYVPKKGDLIHFSIYLGHVGKNHEMDAEVVRHEGRGFGVFFLKRAELFEKLTNR